MRPFRFQTFFVTLQEHKREKRFNRISMDNDFVQEMREQLEEERQLLDNQLSMVSSPDTGDHVAGERNPKFPNYGDDALGEETESPAEVAEYGVNVSVTGTLESQLHAVQRAIARIENGTFGTCVSCGEPIGEDRLRVNPSAETCMECAE